MKILLFLMIFVSLILIIFVIRLYRKNLILKKSVDDLRDIVADLKGSAEQVSGLGLNLEKASIEQMNSISTTASASHQINSMILKTNDVTDKLYLESQELGETSSKGISTVNIMLSTSKDLKEKQKTSSLKLRKV